MEDSRCKSLLNGAMAGMEDPRCRSLTSSPVSVMDDPRCRVVAMEMDDARCQHLHFW